MFLEQKLDEMQEQLRNLNQFMMMLMPDLSSKKIRTEEPGNPGSFFAFTSLAFISIIFMLYNSRC